jgi:hypothetical protein
MPMICLLIPGMAFEQHMQRIQFWQKNLSQITTVILSSAIDNHYQADQTHIQLAYDDIIKKFNEVCRNRRQEILRLNTTDDEFIILDSSTLSESQDNVSQLEYWLYSCFESRTCLSNSDYYLYSIAISCSIR